MATTSQLEALPSQTAASIVAAGSGQRVNERKERSMARRRYQKGSVILRGSNWYGRYRESIVGHDGHEVRIRRRYQKGSVILRGSNWYGRYRESIVGHDGHEVRIRRSVILGSKRDFPTKRLAERRLEVFIAPINSISYRPGRVATVEEFAERWRIEILSKRKPSTIHAAESHLRNQILPILGKIRL